MSSTLRVLFRKERLQIAVCVVWGLTLMVYGRSFSREIILTLHRVYDSFGSWSKSSEQILDKGADLPSSATVLRS